MQQPESGPTCVLSPDDPELAVARRGEGSVVALRNLTTGVDHALDPAPRRWLLGSRPSCDLVVDDAFVSGVHCAFERRGVAGALSIRDRGSRNGTFVDGTPVEAAVLRPGSLVTVGKTTLVAVAGAASRARSALEQLRGNDPVFRAAIGQALRAASTACSVLVVGETGTGKDLIARLVHEASPRRLGPYVAVNCGAIPRELIGSELFGHDRGAFTGAVGERDGLFVQATGGTLFLDEIGELPIEQQPHLLRVLENRRVRRLGGLGERPVDARIVSATNRLDGLGTAASQLRLDLFHRIATVVIALPPLRERGADIAELVTAMMNDLAPQHGAKEVSAAGWSALAGYDWPGNVRELHHAVARAMALGGPRLGPADFFSDLGGIRGHKRALRAAVGTPPPLPAPVAQRAAEAGAVAPTAVSVGLPPYELMLRDAMIDALATCKTIRRAARHLGMAKSTFADKARAWGLLPKREMAPE